MHSLTVDDAAAATADNRPKLCPLARRQSAHPISSSWHGDACIMVWSTRPISRPRLLGHSSTSRARARFACTCVSYLCILPCTCQPLTHKHPHKPTLRSPCLSARRFSAHRAPRFWRIPNSRRAGTSSISSARVSKRLVGQHTHPCGLLSPATVFAVHQNYVGIDTDKQPYFLSIVSQDSGNQCMPLYRVMLFRKEVSAARND